jgi:hypothetical protein
MKLPHQLTGTLAIAGLAIATLCAAQEATDGFSLRIPGRGWLQMAGVCNADPQQITCWKPNGEPDPKLSELLNAYYLVNPQQRLEIRYKHRSLMLVIKSMFSQVSGQGNINFNNIQVDPGGQLNQQGTIGYGGQGEESTTFFWYYPTEGLATIDASAVLNTTTEPVKVSLAVGAEARLPGGTFRITRIEKGSDNDAGPNPNIYDRAAVTRGPHWEVSYTLVTDGAEPVASIYATAFDHDGNPISQVDAKGNPVKPKPGPFAYDGMHPYRPIVSANGVVLLLAVNPDKVSSLSITGAAQKKVLFKNVNLQPNRTALTQLSK